MPSVPTVAASPRLETPENKEESAVKDYQASHEKLRADAAEHRLICDLATDRKKQETFAKRAAHLTRLADEVEHAMIEADKPKRA